MKSFFCEYPTAHFLREEGFPYSFISGLFSVAKNMTITRTYHHQTSLSLSLCENISRCFLLNIEHVTQASSSTEKHYTAPYHRVFLLYGAAGLASVWIQSPNTEYMKIRTKTYDLVNNLNSFFLYFRTRPHIIHSLSHTHTPPIKQYKHRIDSSSSRELSYGRGKETAVVVAVVDCDC
jgi:hypothetical protein